MSGYLDRVTAQVTGTAAVVRIRAPSRFEPAGPFDGARDSAGPVEDTEPMEPHPAPARPPTRGADRAAGSPPASAPPTNEPPSTAPPTNDLRTNEPRTARSERATTTTREPATSGRGVDTAVQNSEPPRRHQEPRRPETPTPPASASASASVSASERNPSAGREAPSEPGSSSERVVDPSAFGHRPRAAEPVPPYARTRRWASAVRSRPTTPAAIPTTSELIREHVVPELVAVRVIPPRADVDVHSPQGPPPHGTPGHARVNPPVAVRVAQEPVIEHRMDAPPGTQVHVHIARVDVRPPAPAPPRTPQQAVRRSSAPDHEAYLARRREDRR